MTKSIVELDRTEMLGGELCICVWVQTSQWCVFLRAVPVLCVSDAAVFGVVVLVAGRAPDYISTAARKRDEPAWRVC